MWLAVLIDCGFLFGVKIFRTVVVIHNPNIYLQSWTIHKVVCFQCSFLQWQLVPKDKWFFMSHQDLQSKNSVTSFMWLKVSVKWPNPWINSSLSNWPGIWVGYTHLIAKLLQKIHLGMWRPVFWKISNMYYIPYYERNSPKVAIQGPILVVYWKRINQCRKLWPWIPMTSGTSFSTHPQSQMSANFKGALCAWSSKTFLLVEILFGKVTIYKILTPSW